MLNRLVHKALFTSEVMLYEKGGKLKGGEVENRVNYADPKNLKYDIDDVPQDQSYDHYKNKAALVRQTTKKTDNLQELKTVPATTKAIKNKPMKNVDDDNNDYTQEEEKKTQNFNKRSSSFSKMGKSPVGKQDFAQEQKRRTSPNKHEDKTQQKQ